MPNPQRRCAFCGRTGMTKQHVFGDRLLAFLEKKTSSHYVIDTLPDDIRVKKVDGNIWSKRLRRVCPDCNGGWMRSLEERSFPILSELLLGEAAIPESYCKTLAARLSQIIMVADPSVPDDHWAVHQVDRTTLRLTGEAPSGWLIFLCRADVSVESGQYYHADAFRTQKVVAGQIREILDNNYVSTFLIGKLCVHALTRAPAGYQGYAGVTLARLWPMAEGGIDLLQSSLLGPTKIVELGASFRKFHT